MAFWDGKVWVSTSGFDEYFGWTQGFIESLKNAVNDKKHEIDPSVVYTLLPDGSVKISLDYNYYERPKQDTNGPWLHTHSGDCQCYWRQEAKKSLTEVKNWSLYKYICTVEEAHEDFMKYKPE